MSSQEAENRRNQIDRYVNGEMSVNEVNVFEQRMRENGALAEEVLLHRDVLVGMNHYFNLDLKNKLKEEEARLKKKPVSIFKWIGIAASIALVITVAYFAFYTGQTDPQQLYTQYYNVYPNIVAPVQRSDNSDANPGLALYETGNYAEALKIFEQQIAGGEDETYILFYAGIAALNTHQEADAIAYLDKVIARGDETFANPAQWYLGLAYLKSGQTEEGIQVFEAIEASGNDYSQRASDILKDL